MPAIPWNPSFSVAHPELDCQHMEVLTLMNEMERLLVSAPGNYERKKRLHILERLLHYGCRHSALEMRVLRQWGCDCVQGYFISRPLPAEALVAWLGEREAQEV